MPSPDLAAIVLMVRARESKPIHQHMGRAIQQLALDIVRRYSPALSEALHGGNHEAKPYAVSGLLRLNSVYPLMGTLQAGDTAWLRIVGLNAQVVEALENYTKMSPAAVEIDHVSWKLDDIITTPERHPWAGHASYPELLWQCENEAISSSISFYFAAPTGFRSKRMNVPLPIPLLVFGSLVNRWNSFAPTPLPEQIIDFIGQYIAVTQYRTETDILTLKHGARQVGFTGEVSYTILAKNDGLMKHNPELAAALASRHTEFSRTLAMLSKFAFYSGVGIKTTTGMGMVHFN